MALVNKSRCKTMCIYKKGESNILKVTMNPSYDRFLDTFISIRKFGH